MIIDATFWVAISFLIFVILLIYFKIPSKVKNFLDENINQIKKQVDESEKLKEEAKRQLAEYEKRIADYVAATGEPIMIDDVRSTRDPLALGASMACVPLVLQDRIVGTLTLFDKFGPLGRERRRFSVDDLNMLFALSSQIAAEIEDIRLTGRLQELVRSEKQQGAQLQQLYNRLKIFFG